jgi:hypothetical protein
MKYGITDDTQFEQQVQEMIDFPDLLNQSYYTDFCGYYIFTRFFIQQDQDTFKWVIRQLYQNGNVEVDGVQIVVTEAIAKALQAGLQPDIEGQTWGNLHLPENGLPNNTQMLYMLSLADKFSRMPFAYQPYSNEKHDENKGLWAGMTFEAEKHLFETFGFTTESYGDNDVTYFKDAHRHAIFQAMKEGYKVAALVNSYQLYKKTAIVLDTPRGYDLLEETVERKLGTHWVGLSLTDLNQPKFWDYGRAEGTIYNGDIFEVMAGAIILKGYQ